MSISFGGIASGLDSNNIVRQLTSLARQPIRDLQSRQSQLRRDLTNISGLTSKIKDLENVAKDFAELGGVLANSAQSSNEDAVLVSADGDAATGSYEIRVDQLARGAKERSGAFTSSTDEVAAGTLTIGVFGEDSVDVEIAEGATLADVRDAINSSGAAVDATIIDTGNGVYLNIASQKVGHEVGGDPAAALNLSMNTTGTTGTPVTFSTVQTAQNAIFELEGLSIERSTNTVNDAIDGITFDLQGTMEPGETAEIVVTPDREKIMEQLQGFVDAYNAVVEAIKEQSDAGTERRALDDFRRAAVDGVSGATGDFPSLAALGISSTSTGRLEIDDEAVNEAIENDPRGLASVFTAPGGVSERLTAMVERYTDSTNGVISMMEDSLNSQIDGIDDQIERKERYVDAYNQRLTNQFNQLEILTVRLQDAQARFASFVPFVPQTPQGF
jgi:flagellar hook-associated protein 2